MPAPSSLRVSADIASVGLIKQFSMPSPSDRLNDGPIYSNPDDIVNLPTVIDWFAGTQHCCDSFARSDGVSRCRDVGATRLIDAGREVGHEGVAARALDATR